MAALSKHNKYIQRVFDSGAQGMASSVPRFLPHVVSSLCSVRFSHGDDGAMDGGGGGRAKEIGGWSGGFLPLAKLRLAWSPMLQLAFPAFPGTVLVQGWDFRKGTNGVNTNGVTAIIMFS